MQVKFKVGCAVASKVYAPGAVDTFGDEFAKMLVRLGRADLVVPSQTAGGGGVDEAQSMITETAAPLAKRGRPASKGA